MVIKKKKWKLAIALIMGTILTAFILTTIIPQIAGHKDNNRDVISVSILKDIINVNELSTFTAVYNGITQVMNKENPDEIDYYVSYEAKIDAGLDFEKIDISVNNTEKTVNITLPDIHITNTNVDIASLDYIFVNDKANTFSISQEAYKTCKADVEIKSKNQEEIIQLAKQNAENILTALVRPIIEQLDSEYTLTIA